MASKKDRKEKFQNSSGIDIHRIYHEEETYILLELENRKFLPLPWLRITVQLSNELEVISDSIRTITGDLYQTVVLRGSIGWYEKKSWKVAVASKHRGNFRIDSPVIHTSDLFGLFPRKQQFDVRTSLIVYPKIIELNDLILDLPMFRFYKIFVSEIKNYVL